MGEAGRIYEKYRRADDEPGDAAWAAKQGKRAVWVPEEDRTVAALDELQLSDDERVVVRLLRLPRRYTDVEACGAMASGEARRFLRALHAAEVLETQDLDRAKALVPLEVKRARAELAGKPVERLRRRSKLVGQVYRPPIDERPERPEPPPQAPAPKPVAAESDPNDAGATSEADMALEREIGQALKHQRNADHFAVLGVSKEAISDEIKESYFNLAKRFHPDRLAGYTFKRPEIIEDKIEKVFGRITDAYQALQDPDRRQEYLREIESGLSTGIKTGGKVRRTEEAGLQHRKGMVFLHKKDFANAQRMFQIAAELDNGNPIHPAYWAWSRFLDEHLDKQQREKEARQKLEAIMKESPQADAAYFLGMILKLADEEDQAHKRFRKAVELNPEHKEAQREVRLHQMRRERSKAPQSAGLLDRFLKK